MRAVDSVLEQTFTNLELIVVDDASSDSTADLIKNCHDERIHYVRHERNLGASASRNTGIRLAQGEFVALLDSDDQWLPEKLEIYLAAIHRYAADGAVGSYRRIYLNGICALMQVSQDSLRAPGILERAVTGAGSSLVVRREQLIKVGLFDEHMRRHEDWDLMVRLTRECEIVTIERPLFTCYISGYPALHVVQRAEKVLFAKLTTDLATQPWHVRRKIRSEQALRLANASLKSGHRIRALHYTLRAVLLRPRSIKRGIRTLVHTPDARQRIRRIPQRGA